MKKSDIDNLFNDTPALSFARIRDVVAASEHLEHLHENDDTCTIQDKRDDRFIMYYRDPFDELDARVVTPDGFDRDAFLALLPQVVDPNSLHVLNQLVILGDENDLEQLLEDHPDKSFDMDGLYGCHWYDDHVVVVNLPLIVEENAIDPLESFWVTLFHELRHVVTQDPVCAAALSEITRSEDAVESYAQYRYEYLAPIIDPVELIK